MEIKFRFWKDGKMKYWEDFSCLDMCDWLNKDDVVAMQYTGIKDKNGKEIYDGDVVKFREIFNDKAFTGYFSWQEELLRYRVYDIDDDGDCYDVDATGGPTGDLDTEELIVVGNIYENKDLLTQEV